MSPLCARQKNNGVVENRLWLLPGVLSPASGLAQVLPSVSEALSSPPGTPTEADLRLRFSSLPFHAPKVLLPVFVIWASVVW